MGNLYTIGHSTVSLEYFLKLLKKYNIDYLFDVRSVPYSKYASQFNKDEIMNALECIGINYVYMGKYFGARQEDITLYSEDGILDFDKVRESYEFRLRVDSTKRGLQQGHNIAMMCTEKDPFDCHRSIMIARAFELDGILVNHITHSEQLLSQENLNKRLLDYFFPNRDQLVLNFGEIQEKTDDEYLNEAYRRRNKQIGYRLSSEYREVV